MARMAGLGDRSSSAPLNRETPELNLMLVKQQAGFPSPADVQAVMPIEEFHGRCLSFGHLQHGSA